MRAEIFEFRNNNKYPGCGRLRSALRRSWFCLPGARLRKQSKIKDFARQARAVGVDDQGELAHLGFFSETLR